MVNQSSQRTSTGVGTLQRNSTHTTQGDVMGADAKETVMHVSSYTTQDIALNSWTWIDTTETATPSVVASDTFRFRLPIQIFLDPVQSVRQWLDTIEVRSSKFAHLICKLIPAQCPFERDITVFNRTLIHIPPLCKLNPCYEQVVALRFRALCYLADECGEDITPYC